MAKPTNFKINASTWQEMAKLEASAEALNKQITALKATI